MYLRRAAAPSSLLLLPMGRSTMVSHLLSALSTAGLSQPRVLCMFEPDAAYERAVRAACPSVGNIASLASFRELLAGDDPSDSLLIIDPSCFPAPGLDVRPLLPFLGGDFEMVRHLVALETTAGDTKEFVHSDADGRVRKIQRYYHPVTWPFASGVVCSLIPVASIRMAPDLPLDSLPALRRSLAARGIPSRDVALPGSVFDLTNEAGALGLSEQCVLELTPTSGRERRATGSASPPAGGSQGNRCTTHPSARLLGPVVLSDDVVIGEDVLITGPSVIGSGARIGRGAVVAQCLVMPGVEIPAGATVRQRVVSGNDPSQAPMPGADTSRAFSASSRHVTPVEMPRYEARPSVYPAAKRVVEGVLASVALMVLAPLLAVVACIVKLGSRGPIFYGAQREGRDGEVFRCWKFRTMYVGAEAMQRELAARNQMDGPQFKLARDPRVTTVGRWLRAANIDELPQLFNVVRGQMSFVGPRPSPFRENQICVPWRQGRLSVRPGITGLWQICRHDRSNGDFHQWIQYDLLYVRYMRATLDLKILVATILTLGGRRPVPVSWIIPEADATRAAVQRAASGGASASAGRSARRWLARVRS